MSILLYILFDCVRYTSEVFILSDFWIVCMGGGSIRYFRGTTWVVRYLGLIDTLEIGLHTFTELNTIEGQCQSTCLPVCTSLGR